MGKGQLAGMTKLVYTEFGVGDNFINDIQYKSQANYYTIGIDKTQSSQYLKYKQFVDQYIVGDWCNDYNIPQADEWGCRSCFEHIHPDLIDQSIHGIISKIKSHSQGYVHIDLTDHHSGFEHYKDPNYWNGYYINTIKHLEWEEIFSKYFTYDVDYSRKLQYLEHNQEHPRCINFHNVRIKP